MFCPIILRIQAPLTIQTNSPLELVQQLFAKLGAKYVIVTDPSGHCELFIILCFVSLWRLRRSVSLVDEGVIEKNAWIAFLNNLENEE